MPISGEHPRAEAIEGMGGIFAVFPEGIRFDVTASTAQGERVAVEAESHGDHVSGIHYNNRYHFLVVVRDGKIRELREYMDTQMAQEVLFDSLAGAAE
jgi:ketosteroid isomerase-like protein